MLLKLGSTGESVEKVQEKLGLKVDGSFGPITESKVKEWQSKNGLTSDGIIGPKTWSLMFGESIQIPSNSDLNIEKLKGHIPDSVISQIPDTASKFNITTKLRLAHFLAQCSHESGGFRVVFENLNYSQSGLQKIFGTYFPNAQLLKEYANQPQKIASRVYGNRMGNGNEQSGEGWNFRGRGYIQLTGKNNYQAFAKFIGEDVVSNPDLVATKYPMMSAAYFFDSNKLWTICDRGSTDEVVTQVTRRVNGGTNGLADRIQKFRLYFNLLNS